MKFSFPLSLRVLGPARFPQRFLLQQQQGIEDKPLVVAASLIGVLAGTSQTYTISLVCGEKDYPDQWYRNTFSSSG